MQRKHAVLRPQVIAAAAVLFAILVAHALLETARDALFLAQLGPHLLAAAYLAMAGAALIAVAVVRRGGRVRHPRGMLVGFLVLATAGTAVLAVTITLAPVFVFVLYVWTGFVATLVVPSFWTAIDRSLRVSEAKRVFGVIGAGGVLGAMVGSALAGVLGQLVAPAYLVTAGALAFALATLAAAALVPRTQVEEIAPKRSRADALTRRSRRYIRTLLALALVSTIVLTLGDLTFKRVVAERLPARELATAFGAIYTGLNAIGLAIQIAVTPRLLARWGVGGALTVLPLLLVVSAAGFVMTGTIVAVLALKLGDGSLRHSLHRVGSEILYLPVPSAVRDGWKLVADALGQRGGQAIAAVVVFFSASSTRGLAALTAVCGLGWLGLLVAVRRGYVSQFRDTLQAGEIQRDVALPALDADSIARLTESLASPDEVEALAALDLVARYRGVPALVFYHPSPAVVRRALALLDGELRLDTARVLQHLLAHSDPKIRAAALAASIRTGGPRERLVAALDDLAPEPRAMAVVGLVASGADLEDRLAAMTNGPPAVRLAVAEAIGFLPEARFRDTLLDLLGSGITAVMRQVLHVWAHAPALADRAQLLALLREPRVRFDVRRVFVALGRSGLESLVAALEAPHTSLAIRRHLPRTLCCFRASAAAAALVRRLPQEPDARTEINLLRALGRMRADNPALDIDAAPIRAYLRRATRDAVRYAMFSTYLARHPIASASGALIAEVLADQRRTAIEHAFRALGILYPLAGLRSAYDAFCSDDDGRRAAAREIVGTLLPVDVRGSLLAVLDNTATVARTFANDHAFFSALLVDPSEPLRSVVTDHVQQVAAHG